MSLPTQSSLAICRDVVVDMLNDADRAWSGEFDAVAMYLPAWEPGDLQELCVGVSYGKTERETSTRQDVQKLNYIDITFRKLLEPPDGTDDVAQVIAEMDALAAIVETVADFFAANTQNAGWREITGTKAYVSNTEIFPTWSPEELSKNRAFLSVITLWVTGITGVIDPDNE